MPDRRSHRGPHPEDAAAFAPACHAALREAVSDLSWLLTRGYADRSAVKIVGDRFSLTARQRMAIQRCACSDDSLARRRGSQVSVADSSGGPLLLDGYNVLTTVEAALGGGVILGARDGCYRDLASMHGTFRSVEETFPALRLIGETLTSLGVHRAVWYLDSPVSNSGRLRAEMLRIAHDQAWSWDVELIPNPDRVLAEATSVIVSADSVILDRCTHWYNLAREVVTQHVPEACVANLG